MRTSCAEAAARWRGCESDGVPCCKERGVQRQLRFGAQRHLRVRCGAQRHLRVRFGAQQHCGATCRFLACSCTHSTWDHNMGDLGQQPLPKSRTSTSDTQAASRPVCVALQHTQT